MLRKKYLLLFSGLIILILLLFPLLSCVSGGKTSAVVQTTTIAEVNLFNNNNIDVVDNNPTNPTVFTLTDSYRITSITTYHWNYGSGTALPGTVGLRDSSGNIFGPWNATGSPGQGGVPNALWTVQPNVVIGPGTYTIVDSDNATWSQNSDSNNQGMTFGVIGIKATAIAAATNTTKTTAAAATQMVVVPLVTQTLAPSTTSQQVTWNNQVTVTVPGGLLTSSTPLTISRVDNAPADTFSGLTVLTAYDISLGNMKEFDKNLTIEIAYDPTKLQSDLPTDQSLGAEWWDASQNTWWRTVSQVDTQRNVVVISTNHLSRWRIFMLLRGDQEYNSKHFIVVWNQQEAPKMGGVLQDPKVFAKKVSDYLEAAWQVYLAQGYDVAFASDDEMPKGWDSGPIVVGHIWVVIDQSTAESETGSLSGDITLKSDYRDDDEIKQDTAHELFHTTHLNKVRAPTYVQSQWWAEATADYAATRVAWPNLNGMSMLSGSYFRLSLTNLNDVHEYENARFIEYLVGHGISFNQLFNDMAAAGVPTPESLAVIVQKATGKSLLEQYSNFTAYVLFDTAGPIQQIVVAPSLLSGSAPSKVAPNSLSASATDISFDNMGCNGSYGGELWGFKVSASSTTTPRTLKVQLTPATVNQIDTLPAGKTFVGVYILKNDQRVLGGVQPQAVLSAETTSAVIQANDGDVVYIHSINADTVAHFWNVDVSEITPLPPDTQNLDFNFYDGNNNILGYAYVTAQLTGGEGSLNTEHTYTIKVKQNETIHLVLSVDSNNIGGGYHLVYNFPSTLFGASPSAKTDQSETFNFTLPNKGTVTDKAQVTVNAVNVVDAQGHVKAADAATWTFNITAE
jgi:hypothetical protein